MKEPQDNFEQCEENIRKYNDPAGGDPDYWHDKYAPRHHSKTYLKQKYKPQKHSKLYYQNKYIYGGKSPKEQRKEKPKKNSSRKSWLHLETSEQILMLIVLFLILIAYLK